MASYNDVTGDRLINTPKRGPREGQKRAFVLDTPAFEVKHCENCHIKISTSNNKCPLCGRELP